jgi:hypothetical protein
MWFNAIIHAKTYQLLNIFKRIKNTGVAWLSSVRVKDFWLIPLTDETLIINTYIIVIGFYKVNKMRTKDD